MRWNARCCTLAGAFVLSASLTGCVTVNGALSGAERRYIAKTFAADEKNPERRTDRGNQYADRDDAVELGRHLFFFTGFTAPKDPTSGKTLQATSCGSCHAPELNFSDGLARGIGASGSPLARRSPSLYQTVNRHFLFWDGRTDSLWSQALAPIEDRNEMGSNRLRTLHMIAANPQLKSMYEQLFGALPVLPTELDAYPCEDGNEVAVRAVPTGEEQTKQLNRSALQNNAKELVGPVETAGGRIEAWCSAWKSLPEKQQTAIDQAFVNVGKAIAAYEARIVSKDSPFDAYLAGDAVKPDTNLDRDALRGLELFVSKRANCSACHSGPDLSDDRFHFLGIADHEPLAQDGTSLDPVAPGLWVEGAFQLYASKFNCLHAADYGSACAKAPRDRLDGGLRSVRSIIRFKLGQRATAAQVRTPSLRNVAGNKFFMHDGHIGSETDDALARAVTFYSTLPNGKRGVGIVKPGLKAEVGRTRYLRLATSSRKRIDRRARHVELSADEIKYITAFLRTLTGKPIDERLRTNPWTSATVVSEGPTVAPSPATAATEPAPTDAPSPGAPPVIAPPAGAAPSRTAP